MSSLWRGLFRISLVSLAGALALLFLITSGPAAAREPIVFLGDTLTMPVTVCYTKESAIAILEKSATDLEAAQALFMADDGCGGVETSFVVGRVVREVSLGEHGTGRVVEISNPSDPKMKLYWITRASVRARARGVKDA